MSDRVDDSLRSIKYLGNERRGHSRFPYRIPVVLRNGGEHEGEVHNLSYGGMFIVSEWEPDQDQELSVHLELPGLSAWLRCQVRWVMKRGEGHGFGVAFTHIPDEVIRAIRALEQDENLRTV